MKYDNQLRYAVNIVREYNGSVPLSVWLRDFYKINKQMGSRDRRTVSEMVYGFYRLGHNGFSDIGERIISAINLTDQLPEVSEYFRSKKSLQEKDETRQTGQSFHLSGIFPWQHLLSDQIDRDAFSRSFLIQPDLFLRIRPDKKNDVLDKLNQAKISYNFCEDDCLSLSNTTRIDTLIHLNREAVIQDKSSQQTGTLIKQSFELLAGHSKPNVWDCCAGSGGKSILAWDKANEIDLTVSDKRSSILDNLHLRLNQAGIQNYHSFIADLTKGRSVLPEKKYDFIIADVPCSGSGTWARTPEQLYFFKKEKIDYYSDLQKTIVSRVIPLLDDGGCFLYITCSVFANENEDVVKFIIEKHGLKLLEKQIYTGYEYKADTLFAALFTN